MEQLSTAASLFHITSISVASCLSLPNKSLHHTYARRISLVLDFDMLPPLFVQRFQVPKRPTIDYSAAPQLSPALTASINASTASSSLPLQFDTWQYVKEPLPHLPAYFKLFVLRFWS